MRIVRHIGARTFDGDTGNSIGLLVAMPVFRGERIRWIEGEFYGATQADEPPEQPSLQGMFVGYLPGMIFEDRALSTATIEQEIGDKLLGDAIQNKQFYGGEPNDSAEDVEWMEGDQVRQFTGARVLWRKVTMTDVRLAGGLAGVGTQVSGSGTFTAEGKQAFREKFRIRGGFIPVQGMIVMGHYAPRVTAQTTFGVTELDSQMTIDEVIQGLMRTDVTADSDEAKLAELVYGGDNYIEADTLKDFDGRVYCRASAGFSGGVLERLERLNR